MERSHYDRWDDLQAAITGYEADHGPFLGLGSQDRKDAWVMQMISSLRRIEYVRNIPRRPISPRRCDPHDELFDPISGAAFLAKQGKRDEAVWMTFVATHLGKHAIDGWKLAANVMGSFNGGPVWTAARYGADRAGFQTMLTNHQAQLTDPIQSGRFSNHRQYQSKKASVIASVFSSYYDWQFQKGDFNNLVQAVHQEHGQEPTGAFDALYRSHKQVFGFGRLGTFDFLTMLGKLDLAPIEPGSAYMIGATGPLSGAKLLFFNDTKYNVSAGAISPRVDGLDDYLKTGKQVIEDSLCNWQKSPDKYLYFRG